VASNRTFPLREKVGWPFDEEQRQMVVLALAELAVARPGWLNALRGCAERIDSAELFRDFMVSLERKHQPLDITAVG